MPSIPNLPKGSRQQLQNICVYKVFIFSFFCNYLLLLKAHSNKRHPLWWNPWFQPFQVSCNPAFLKVWDWSPTRTTPRHKRPIHSRTFPEWNLRLKLLTEVTYSGKGIHSNRGSWMDRMRFWANQTSSSTLQSSLKQGFILNDIPGNFYTGRKKSPLLTAKSIMLFCTVFSRN